MKMIKEFIIGTNKEKWGRLVPGNDIDKEILIRIYIEILGHITELKDYRICLDTDGLREDGSLPICVAKEDDDQTNCCGGFVSMLAFGGEYHVDIDFDPTAKRILPESLRGDVGYEFGYDAYGETSNMERIYRKCKKMIDSEYPSEAE